MFGGPATYSAFAEDPLRLIRTKAMQIRCAGLRRTITATNPLASTTALLGPLRRIGADVVSIESVEFAQEVRSDEPEVAPSLYLRIPSAAMSREQDAQLLESLAVRRNRLRESLLWGRQRRRRATTDNLKNLAISLVLAAVASVGCVGWSVLQNVIQHQRTQQTPAPVTTGPR
jgi:hypothetical protein